MAITLNLYTGPPSQPISGAGVQSNVFAVPATVGNLLSFFLVTATGIPTIRSGTTSNLQVTDNKNNIWIVIPMLSLSGSTYIWGAYCCGAVAGVTEVTLTYNIPTSGALSIGFYDQNSTDGGALYSWEAALLRGKAPFAFVEFSASVGSVVAAALAGASTSESGPTLAFVSANSPYIFEAMDSADLSSPTATNVAGSCYYLPASAGTQNIQLNLSNIAGSSMAAMSFIDAVPAATPVITPNGGTFATAPTVTLTCSTPSSTITYTTDGSIPIPGSHGTVYSGPITVATSEVITAIASAAGYLNSALAIADFGIGSPEVFVAEVQITITYQNPGNYLYARDLDSWGDGGTYGENNGTPYAEANFTIGSITLYQLGAKTEPLQHVVLYADAVGTLDNGGPSQPTVWILPNEISDTAGIGFQQLVEVLQEPPVGQNQPSKSIQALRYPVNSMNSYLASQLIRHLQLKIQFEPELAPNVIKAVAFKSEQD